MKQANAKSVPTDVYIPFVQSLYADRNVLVWGGLSQGATALVVYLYNRQPVYLVLAVLLVAVGIFRYAGIRRREAQPAPTTREEAQEWERDYLIRGAVQGALLGLYCFVSLYLRPDPLAEVAAVIVTLGSALGIVGRNYASNRMVLILAATMTIPISAGLVLRGDVFSIAIGLLIVPFCATIVQMAGRVRETFLSVIYEKKKANGLAQKFDRALNTMSHGLIMLDSSGKVAVANSEATQVLAMGDPDRMLGRTLGALLMRGVAAGFLSRRDALFVTAQLNRALRDGRDRKLMLNLSDGRHYEFSAREGTDELGVITFEEVTARVESEEKIRYMARYDNLTGLPNRAYFHELVGEALAAGDPTRNCALAILDLDDFKEFNDTLGHPMGDRIIQAVAERLGRFAQAGTHVSRIGGDEFMVYFDALENEAALEAEMKRLAAMLAPTIDVGGHTLHIHASIGTVLLRITDANVDSMIVKADLALYKAKEAGKNGWSMFESVMDAEFRNRQLMKAELRQTIEQGGLRIVYQPIVSLDTMRIASCEALCRWDHPQFGSVSPAIFIPLAEEMGIISDLSLFMLRSAAKECVKWPESIGVSVNLSAKDFVGRDVIDGVRSALANSGLDPHRLEIEVTETALLDDKSSTRSLLEELKGLGVRIALDDFGTGYSSLSYLHTLPLDRVKIDRSFIEDLTTNERSKRLLEGVVNISRALNLKVTIEGVETSEQLRILANEIRPELVQGFLFGSALSASGIQTMSTTTWPFAQELLAEQRLRLAGNG
ncbi:MAG: EAL domain-containing protein [Mesorhizobium sp.]